MAMAHVFITDDTLRQELHRTIDSLLAQRGALRAELNVALDALRAAPKPQSRYLGLTEALIAWRENYDLWYEGQRQAALGLAEGE